LHQVINIDCTETQEKNKDADYHCRIPDACDNKGFSSGISIYRLVIPEADQQVTAQTDTFPTKIQKQNIISEHKNQH
jgi:hypothetical protein